jgi:glycosyltransferase involved in cell wall biosynthesis
MDNPMDNPMEQGVRVSIVTPCYNSAATLEATIQSVLGQTYPHIEYIIMDGGSTDATAEIAARYRDRLLFVSERDRGQSDAINKGWQRSTGQIVAWLNADDQYLPDTVEQAVTWFNQHPETMWLYGTAESIDERGQPFAYRNYRDTWDYAALTAIGCYINQPSVFLRRQVLDEFGYIETALHFCMDYEYWLRIGQTYPAQYVPQVRARIIRASTTKTESGGVARLREVEAVARRYGAADLPGGMRHEWGWVFLEDALKQARQGRWDDAAAAFRQAGRYPAALPRSVVKLIFRLAVPRPVETWLRQRFVR